MKPDTSPTRPPRVLVVGGAGYIGSHMVKYLLPLGYLCFKRAES